MFIAVFTGTALRLVDKAKRKDLGWLDGLFTTIAAAGAGTFGGVLAKSYFSETWAFFFGALCALIGDSLVITILAEFKPGAVKVMRAAWEAITKRIKKL